MNTYPDERMLSDLLKYAGKPIKQWNISEGEDNGDGNFTISKYPGMTARYPVDPMSFLVRKKLGLRDRK